MALITLIRHGESVWNEERRIQGNQDPPLSERGRRQAALLLERLPAWVPRRAAAVYGSPLRRAAETAERLAELLSAPLTLDPDLREVRLGRWEGLTVAEIQVAFPGQYERWREDPVACPAPGAEPLEAFAARTAAALERMRRAHPAGPLLLVAHGGTVRALLCHTLGLSIRHLFRFQQDNTAVSQIEVAERGGRLLHMNDTAHLLAGGAAVAARDVITDGPPLEEPTV